METPTYQKPEIDYFALDKDTDAETRKKVFDLLVKHQVPIYDEDTRDLNGIQDPEYPYLEWDRGDISEGRYPLTDDVYGAVEFLAQFGIAFE